MIIHTTTTERAISTLALINKKLSKSVKPLINAFPKMIEPGESILNPKRRRRIRMLSVLLLFTIPLMLSGALATSDWQTTLFLLIGSVSFVVAYIANCLNRDRLAILIVLGFLTILPFFGWYPKHDYSYAEFLSSFIGVILTVLLASLLVDTFTVSLLTIINLGGLLLLPLVFPDLDYMVVLKVMRILLPVSSLLIVGNFIRQRDLNTIERQNKKILADEAQLQHLLISNPAVVYSALPSQDTAFTFISSNISHQLGYSTEEIMSDPNFWANHIHADDVPQFFEGFPALYEKDILVRTYRFRHKDGIYRWLQDEQRLLRDSEGQPFEIVGYFIDITEQARTEGILHLQTDALNAAANAIVIVNRHGDITWTNPAFTTITGYTAEEVPGQNLRFLRSEERSDEFCRDIWETINVGKTWRGDIVSKRKDGSPFTVDVTISPVRSMRDGSTHCVAILQDITDRQQVQEDLKEQTIALQRSYSLIAALSEVVIKVQSTLDQEQIFQTLEYELNRLGANFFIALLDPENQDLVVQHVSNESKARAMAEKLAGMSTRGFRIQRKNFPLYEELIGWKQPQYIQDRFALMTDILPNPPDDVIKGIAKLSGIRQSVPVIYLPLLSGDRVIGTFAVWGESLQKNDIPTLTIFASQVAGAIRASELFEQAQIANHAKTEFLSRMSHELRTPLNSILGFAQLLEISKKDPLTHSQRERVGQIVQGGKHLLDLINEVLDLSCIEAGRLQMSLEPVPILDCVRQVCEMGQPLAHERDIQIEIPDKSIASLYVLADHQRLKQVFLNLLSNALKYNHQGGRVIITHEVQPGRNLRILVTDTGPGIPSKKLELLFNPFERLGAKSTEVEGTGLGLAVSSRLMALMGGKIGVESSVGQGSTFWVELPMTDNSGEYQIQKDDTGALLELSAIPLRILYIEL